ncbi:MAG TPA: hypothetical protein VLB83_00870 [Candidatus Paceibacterota bacterium]|nr:hypothetical protein [Candidatus Paceibacterota bacterium]
MPRLIIRESFRSGGFGKLKEMDREQVRRRSEINVWVDVGTIILRAVVPRALCPEDLPIREPKDRATNGVPGRIILEQHLAKDRNHRSASCAFHSIPDFYLVDGYAMEGKFGDTMALAFVLSRTRRAEMVGAAVDRAFADTLLREYADVRIYENPEVRAADGTQLSEKNLSVNFLQPVEPTNTLCFVFRPGKPRNGA